MSIKERENLKPVNIESLEVENENELPLSDFKAKLLTGGKTKIFQKDKMDRHIVSNKVCYLQNWR